MTKILITGGAGFIGSNLVDRIVKMKNVEVIIIDNLSTGDSKNVNKKSYLYKENLCRYNSIKKIIETVRPEVVIHLAANANVPLSIQRPLFDFESLEGSLNLIELSKNIRVKKFIYFSSGFIYGNVDERPIIEKQPFQPISPYSISKATTENYLAFYNKVYNLPYVILRPATVYGPRQTGGALNDYITKLSNNQQAEIYGNGSKTRDYIFIYDVVDALIKLILKSIPAEDSQIFNLGTGKETSLLEMYLLIANLLNKIPSPIFLKDRPGELMKYSLNSKKIYRYLAWKPKYSILDGLRTTLKLRKLI